MQKSNKQVIIILITLTLGVLNFVKGKWLWDYLNITDEHLVVSLTIGSTLLVLFSGFLITITSLLNQINDKVDNFKSSLNNEFFSALPHFENFNSFSNTEGLKLLSGRLVSARTVLNTRVTPIGYGELYDDNEASVWNIAIKKEIKRGLVFREIVSNAGVLEARKLQKQLKLTKNVKGSYQVNEIEYTLPSFVNFTIIYFDDGSREVWFGWVLSKGKRFQENCFKSNEPRLVKLFEDWHSNIYSSGNNL